MVSMKKITANFKIKSEDETPDGKKSVRYITGTWTGVNYSDDKVVVGDK